jgi:hypothetical protein
MAEVRSRNERSGVVPNAPVSGPGGDGTPAARSVGCPDDVRPVGEGLG